MKTLNLTMLVIAAALFGGIGPLSAAEHPRLVSAANTDCSVCHDDLVEQLAEVHAPAEDDCTTCHEVEVGEDGTLVSLIETDPELCLICHDEFTEAVELDLETPHYPAAEACSTCHDPHGTELKPLLKAVPRELCLSCHEIEDIDSGHPIPVSRSGCISCHSPHGSDQEHMLAHTGLHAPLADGTCEGCHRRPRGTRIQVRAKGAKLCFACHGDLKERFASGSVHTVVRDGRCTACHDPHLAAHDQLLSFEGNDLCFSCHEEIRILATGDGMHDAVDAGCDLCHDTHQSELPAQLVEPASDLCAQCHDVDDEELSALHLGADLGALRCTSCHDPHGSPVSPLLATGSIHEPFSDGCDLCHEDGIDQLMEGGGQALCYVCHSEIEELVAEAVVPHEALELGECTDCHTPHASRQEHLLKESSARVCAECHDEQIAAADEIAHGAIEWFGCESCHRPHGGDNEKLLRTTGNELCAGCHLSSRLLELEGTMRLAGGYEVSGVRLEALKTISLSAGETLDHPLPRHPVTGLITGEGRTAVVPQLVGQELSCLSCHDPHAGKTRQMLAFDAMNKAELCLSCHPN